MITEYITLSLYLVLLLILGSLFSRMNKNMSDYVRAGAKGTWWMVGSSILMSSISAFTFTGNASAAFESGPSVLIFYIANCTAYLISFLGVAAWFRQTRAYTPADIVRERYGVPAEQFKVYLGTVLAPVGSAVQLWALAVFCSTVYALPLQLTILAVGGIVIIYSTTGGKWAVMATDFLQSLIVFAITLLMAGLVLHKIGGLSSFYEAITSPELRPDFNFVNDPDRFPTGRFSGKWMIAIFLMAMNIQLGINASHRFLSVKDGKEAKKAALFAGILMAMGSIVWFIPPMAARVLYADEIAALSLSNPSEGAYAFIAGKLLPNGLMGIMVAAMFATTMSSMDSGLNSQMGIIVRNMIPRLRNGLGLPPIKPDTEVRLCRIVTILLGLLILFYALLFARSKEIILFDAYLIIGSIIGLPMAIPLLVGIWIRKVPKRGYFPIFIACLLPSIWSIVDSRVFGNPWTIQDRALVVFAFGVIATLVSILLEKYASSGDRESVRMFFKKMHTPVNFKEEIGDGNDHEQLSYMGKVAIFCAFLICLLMFLPNPWYGRMGILFVAGFVGACGALLLVGASKLGKQVERTPVEKPDDKTMY